MNYSEDSWGLRRILRALRRHKKKALAAFVLVMAVSVSLVIFLPRRYPSEARLLVRLGRASMALDPTVTTGDVAPMQETREGEITSAVDVLKSRVLRERVVRELGAPDLLGKEGVSHTLPISDWLVHAGLKEELSDFEAAVERLADDVEIRRNKDSAVISISYEAASPELAKRVVEAYVQAFLVLHVSVNRTVGSYQFFIRQQENLKHELHEASKSLRDAKNEIGILSVAGQRAILEAQIQEVETALTAAEADLASSQAAVASHQRSMRELPERIRTDETAGFPNPAADNMRDRLYQLEIAHLELLSRYTPDHPSVVAAEQQVQKAKRIVTQQEKERLQTTDSVNSNRRQIQLQLLTEQSRAAALRAKSEVLAGRHGNLRTRLRELNEHEVRIAELERKVDLANAAYRSYMSDTEQARIDEDLASGGLSNISVVQPASLETRPSKPRKALILVLGFLLAVLAALGTVIAGEMFRQSFESEDVEEVLNVPVLAAVS